MYSLLFAEGTGFSQWILPAIVLAFVVVYLVYGMFRKNKYDSGVKNMLDKLEVGTKVKTFAGIYGEIVDIREALDGSKVALIKTGENGKESYMSIDLASVYSIDEKDNAELFNEEDAVKEYNTNIATETKKDNESDLI